MKAILTFDLDDPDDRLNYMACVKANDMATCLFNLRFNGQSSKEMREAIAEAMERYNINLEEITE